MSYGQRLSIFFGAAIVVVLGIDQVANSHALMQSGTFWFVLFLDLIGTIGLYFLFSPNRKE